jgi:hypothetical protein
MGQYTQDDGTNPVVGVVFFGCGALFGLIWAVVPSEGLWSRVGAIAVTIGCIAFLVPCVMMIVRQDRKPPG